MSNRAVTDTGLRHLASLSSLNELRLTGHRALTDETLIEIANQGKLKVRGKNQNFIFNSDFCLEYFVLPVVSILFVLNSGFYRLLFCFLKMLCFYIKNSDFMLLLNSDFCVGVLFVF